MKHATIPSRHKKLSSVRRIGDLHDAQWAAVPAREGDVAVFQFPAGAKPVIVEAVSGRSMALVPGDFFLATPGYRESVHWTVGGVPPDGLVPREDYWILAESGVMGALVETSSIPKTYFGQARYLGAVLDGNGRTLNVRDFAVRPAPDSADAGAPVYLVVGTSVEVGKTTAGLTLLTTLLAKGRSRVVVLKATGTTSVTECATYRDFGAEHVFDCLDFGIPTTFPCERGDVSGIFAQALDECLSHQADAVLIECGGDFLGTNVPEFIRCLLPRRPSPTTILAAFDPSGAAGAKRLLEEMGLTISMITGPCADTLISRRRTETICGVPVQSMRT